MALQHKTAVGGITIGREGNGNIGLKLIVADGPIEYAENTHRFVITKNEDVAAEIQKVNADLTARGLQPINAKSANIINATLTACWAAMDAP